MNITCVMQFNMYMIFYIVYMYIYIIHSISWDVRYIVYDS